MTLLENCLKPNRNVLLLMAVCLSFVVWLSQPAAASDRQVDTGYSRQTAYTLPDENLNRLQDLFRRTLEAIRVEFPGQTGTVRAFQPGSGYFEMWVRDAATQIPWTRYNYSRDYLTSWLEEILAYQKEDGGVDDWIAPGPPAKYLIGAPRARTVYGQALTADKNTMMADQEASAVDAAYQVVMATGDRAWLEKPVKGKTLLERLDLSMEYVLKKRFDAGHGLVTSGFSASWGDVSPKEREQRTIYLTDQTPLVAALYANTFFYQAAVELAAIHQTLGETAQAERWTQAAAGLKANINKYLWREDRGFYKTHLLLTPALAEGLPDDSDYFDMPGNAAAALYGIAGDLQSRRIFEVAEKRQRQYGMPTIAGCCCLPTRKGSSRTRAAMRNTNTSTVDCGIGFRRDCSKLSSNGGTRTGLISS